MSLHNSKLPHLQQFCIFLTDKGVNIFSHQNPGPGDNPGIESQQRPGT